MRPQRPATRLRRLADGALALHGRLVRLSMPARLVAAALLFAGALGARFGLADVLPARGFPFLTFFPAVLLSAFLLGLVPGLWCAALSTLAAWFWFMGPSASFLGLSTAEIVALVFFSSILLVDCVVIHVMNTALSRVSAGERRVADSEQRLRRVLDNLFVHVWILGLDGTLREVNEPPLRLAGLGRPEAVGRPFWALAWWPDDTVREQLRAAVARAAGGESVRRDVRMARSGTDGATLDLQIAPLRGADGSVAALVACGVDVSSRVGALADLERSRAEALAAAERAEEERSLLDATFDAVPAGIIVADRGGRLVRMNRANAQIWGAEAPYAGEVREYGAYKGWWADGSARHGHPIAAHEWGLARALRGELCHDIVEIEPFDRPGARRTTLLSAAPVRGASGEVRGGVVSQVDITDRIRAEQAMRDSEERFRALADNIPQLAWMADAVGNVYWFNHRWFEFTGTTPSQMVDEGWRRMHHPEHEARVVQKFREHIASGEPWEDTFPMRGADGTYRWFLSRALPLRDGGGAVTRWFGTNTDITDQMMTERALRDSEDRLLAREAALREADRQKDTFLATLAHELRNPLAPIRAAAHVIRLRQVGDEAVAKMNAVIERQSAQLARLVDDLLDVSRITFGTVTLQPARTDLRSVVEAAIEACRPQLLASGQAFEAHLPAEPLPVEVDDTRIAQCVSNLLNNACKFTPPTGHIRLDVEAAPGGWASVRVRDDGQGISRATLGQVFEMFAQERRSGMHGNSGLGIGLALTRKLVELHGGRIAVHSEGEGRGAEFEILLPRPAGDMAGGSAPARQRSPAAGTARVLVVDDNPDTVASLDVLLDLQGYTVFTAAQGTSALAAVRAHRPQLVLLDIGLPDMTGYEVARRIGEITEGGVRPVLVALTGWGQDEDRERALAAGFDHHLTKPADPEALAAILRAHLHDGAAPPAAVPQ